MSKKDKSKIVRMPDSYFHIRKQRPLSKLMITTLSNACAKQKSGIAFGPEDLGGSFSALVTRGLIKCHSSTKGPVTWYVTKEAIEMMKSLGIEVSCDPPAAVEPVVPVHALKAVTQKAIKNS